MADVELVPPAGGTMDLGTVDEPVSRVVTDDGVYDPAGDGATPAQMQTAYGHSQAAGNPHGATAADIGAPGANILINTDGGNPVNKRALGATDAVATGTYTVDRWYAVHDCTTLRVGAQAGGGLRMTVVTAGAGTSCALRQYVEAFARYAARPLTLSARVKSNAAGAKLTLGDGATTASSSAHTGGGGWETLTVALTPGAAPTALVAALTIPSGAADGQYAEFLWIKLEEGAYATPWTVPLPGDELARCQRYYYCPARGASQPICSAYYYSATNVMGVVHFPVEMRQAPEMVYATGDSGFFMLANEAVDDIITLTLSGATPTAGRIFNNTNVSGTAGVAGSLWTQDAAAFVAFDAEIRP